MIVRNEGSLQHCAKRRRSLEVGFCDRRRDIRLSKAGHALGGDVAQQQSDAKQQHQSGGPEFDAAHQ